MKYLGTLILLILVSVMDIESKVAHAQSSEEAQKEFEILSPSDMDTVITDQLLVVVQLPQSHKSLYVKFMVVLDDEFDLSELIKIKGNYLSVLHDQKMKRGMHQLKILVKRKGASAFEVVHNHFFKVLPAIKENKWINKRQFSQTGNKNYPIKLSGNIQLLSNDVKLSGPGLNLRQEPAFTREVGVNLNLKINKIEIPISGFYTSNARGEFGYRNRLKIGIKRGRIAASIGDHLVDEDRLIFSGLRVNGFAITTPVGKETNLTAVIGKNVDELFVSNNFPLSSEASNTLFNGGLPRYRRNYQYFKLASYYNKELNYTCISLLKAYDIYGDSLIAGLKPKDNLVFGFENYYSMFQKKSTLRINVAISMYTNDNTLPTEMKAYEQLINVNSSTTPLSFKGAQNISALVNYQLKLAKKHALSIEGRRMGASYYSLGNPYLLNNRISVRAMERSTFIKDKLFVNLIYDFMHDNVNKMSTITRENHILSGSFLVSINQDYPVISIGYRTFIGNSYGYSTVSNNKITSNNIFGSIQYSKRFKSFTPQISISRNDMQMISYLSTDNRQQVNDLMIGTSYKQILGFELQGVQIMQLVDEHQYPQKMWSTRLWYLFKKTALKMNIRVMRNLVKVESMGDEMRQSLIFGIEYFPIKKLMINLSAGSSPFTSSFSSDKNYKEQYIQVRLNLFL